MALTAAVSTADGVKRSRKPHAYDKLSDLRLGSGPVNVMGVVVLFKPPYQSKGRDYTCTVEVVDEGCSVNPVPLIFFNREKGRLPRGVNIGDVVGVRKVEVGEFNSRLQGKCRVQCSWLVWDCQQGGGGGRRPSLTSEGASWDHEEMARARQLLDWSSSVKTDSQLSGPASQPGSVPKSPLAGSSLPPIADIVLVEHKIRVIGVVKSVSAPQKSRGPDFFISVVLIDETSPSDGLPLTLFAPVQNQLPDIGDPGCVAYMMNIKITEYDGSLLGCGHQRSKVVCFSSSPNGGISLTGGGDSDISGAVRERASFLLEWAATAQPALLSTEPSQLPLESQAVSSLPLPPSTSPSQRDPELVFEPPTFLTVMFHPTWPLSTLRDVLDDSRDVPSCFRVRLKVLQVVMPLDDCCQLRCPKCKRRFPSSSSSEDDGGSNRECERCSDGDSVVLTRFMYCLSLFVGDASGATSLAHLSDTNADEFFQNLPPANLMGSPSLRRSLLKILTSLCGGRDPFPTPEDPPSLLSDKSRPWINCCVQTSSCKGTQLRIVDTWFLNGDQQLS